MTTQAITGDLPGRARELVNEVANRQAQRTYFGIAATDGHDADLV